MVSETGTPAMAEADPAFSPDGASLAYSGRSNGVDLIYVVPLETAEEFNAYFWNNQIATLLVLPSAFPILSDLELPSGSSLSPGVYWQILRERCCSPVTAVKTLRY
jgi:hypothetical protein